MVIEGILYKTRMKSMYLHILDNASLETATRILETRLSGDEKVQAGFAAGPQQAGPGLAGGAQPVGPPPIPGTVNPPPAPAYNGSGSASASAFRFPGGSQRLGSGGGAPDLSFKQRMASKFMDSFRAGYDAITSPWAFMVSWASCAVAFHCQSLSLIGGTSLSSAWISYELFKKVSSWTLAVTRRAQQVWLQPLAITLRVH